MEEITTTFINIQSDFGFKHVFGTLKNKAALIAFLNALFEGSLTVTDVKYCDKEILPSEQKGKRIVYDVYCTQSINRTNSAFFPESQKSGDKSSQETDHHFILEMQNIYTPPFEERLAYYASKMVAGQGKAGWNYELEPVFVIAVTDFNLSCLSPKVLHDVVLADRESAEMLTGKLHILLCSLKEVPKKWGDCQTELEKVLFIIKNMDTMDTTSTAYREGGYSAIFEAARSSRLTKDEMVAYSQSLEKLRDTRAGIDFAANKAREKALEEGRAEGRAEGLAEGKRLIARNMLAMGLPPETISAVTGLSVSEISSL